MTVDPRNLDSLEWLLESLRPIRLRLLTSIESEASIAEFVTNFDPDLIETFCSIMDADGTIKLPRDRTPQPEIVNRSALSEISY